MSFHEGLLERPRRGNHLGQFYGGDHRTLMRNVGQYSAEGLRRKDSVMLVALKERATGFMRQLDAPRAGPTSAVAEGHLIIEEPEGLLNRFMVDGRPDSDLFDQCVGARVRAAGSRLRAYGEMVDILWSRGKRRAAVELENLWNKLLASEQFSLYCAYGIDVFAGEFHSADVASLLSGHTHLLAAGADGAPRRAVDSAMKTFRVRMRRRCGWRNRSGSGALLPSTEDSILWLREHRPAQALAILRRARERYALHYPLHVGRHCEIIFS